MSKNRKSFIYILEKESGTVFFKVYRIKKNRAIFLGAFVFKNGEKQLRSVPGKEKRMFIDTLVRGYLVNRNHLIKANTPGKDYFIDPV